MLKKIRKMLKSQEGFTLVELMIVVVILGILAGIGIQQYGNVQERARQRVDQTNIKMIADAVRMYQLLENEDPEIVGSFDWSQLRGYGIETKPESPWTSSEYTITKFEDEDGKSLVISNSSTNHKKGDDILIPSLSE